MTDNITNLGMYTQDAKMISPEMCLKDCLENDIGKRGAFKNGKKLLIIALDDTEIDDYFFGFSQAGMSYSDMVALLAIFKKYIIKEMGF